MAVTDLAKGAGYALVAEGVDTGSNTSAFSAAGDDLWFTYVHAGYAYARHSGDGGRTWSAPQALCPAVRVSARGSLVACCEPTSNGYDAVTLFDLRDGSQSGQFTTGTGSVPQPLPEIGGLLRQSSGDPGYWFAYAKDGTWVGNMETEDADTSAVGDIQVWGTEQPGSEWWAAAKAETAGDATWLWTLTGTRTAVAGLPAGVEGAVLQGGWLYTTDNDTTTKRYWPGAGERWETAAGFATGGYSKSIATYASATGDIPIWTVGHGDDHIHSIYPKLQAGNVVWHNDVATLPSGADPSNLVLAMTGPNDVQDLYAIGDGKIWTPDTDWEIVGTMPFGAVKRAVWNGSFIAILADIPGGRRLLSMEAREPGGTPVEADLVDLPFNIVDLAPGASTGEMWARDDTNTIWHWMPIGTGNDQSGWLEIMTLPAGTLLAGSYATSVNIFTGVTTATCQIYVAEGAVLRIYQVDGEYDESASGLSDGPWLFRCSAETTELIKQADPIADFDLLDAYPYSGFANAHDDPGGVVHPKSSNALICSDLRDEDSTSFTGLGISNVASQRLCRGTVDGVEVIAGRSGNVVTYGWSGFRRVLARIDPADPVVGGLAWVRGMGSGIGIGIHGGSRAYWFWDDDPWKTDAVKTSAGAGSASASKAETKSVQYVRW